MIRMQEGIDRKRAVDRDHIHLHQLALRDHLMGLVSGLNDSQGKGSPRLQAWVYHQVPA